jgi:hypothetical protein
MQSDLVVEGVDVAGMSDDDLFQCWRKSRNI